MVVVILVHLLIACIASKTRHVFCAEVVSPSVINTVARTTLHSSSVRRSTNVTLAVAVW